MSTSTSVRIVARSGASKNSQCGPETKNTWARDDPAILVLIAACLTGTPQVLCSSSPSTNYSSCCPCMGDCVQSRPVGNSQPCFVHDSTRFLVVWNHRCDSPMVSLIFNPMSIESGFRKVHLQPDAFVPTLALDTSRLVRGVCLCI